MNYKNNKRNKKKKKMKKSKRPRIGLKINRNFGGNTATIGLGPRKRGQKVIDVRGGFISPKSIINKATSPDGISAINDFMKGRHTDGFTKVLKMAAAEHADKPLSVVFKAVESINKAQKTASGKPKKVKDIVFETLSNGQTALSRSMSQAARGVDSMHATVHKINCVTGKPTSKALLSLAKTESVTKSTIFDTKAQITELINRQSLSNSSGFNLRQFFLPSPRSYMTYLDLLTLMGPDMSDVQKGDGSVQNVYLSVMKARTELAIFNQNRDFPINIKIHLVHRNAPFGEEATGNNELEDLVQYCLWANPKVSDPQTIAGAIGRVPTFYQESAVSATALDQNNAAFHWEHSLKGKGLFDSVYFRTHFKIAKTFSKTLKPTDLLRFTHDHHFGGGIDAMQLGLYSRDAATVDQPRRLSPLSGYFYLIECKGAQNVEFAYQKDATTFESHIGTSPAYYMIDHRKTLTYISSKDADDLTTDGIVVEPVHMRVFTTDPIRFSSDALKTEFRVLSENVASNSTTGMGVGKGHTITLSDANLVTQSSSNPPTKDSGI